jgi:hypothetical protein
MLHELEIQCLLYKATQMRNGGWPQEAGRINVEQKLVYVSFGMSTDCMQLNERGRQQDGLNAQFTQSTDYSAMSTVP